jgi:hypothetical protein
MSDIENIKVIIRIKPLSDQEIQDGGEICVQVNELNGQQIKIDCKPTAKLFTFDKICG